MKVNYTPVKVGIQTESPNISREAFYNLCFITENDLAPRTLVVEKLQDLLDNGYMRSSFAYNFCYGVFSQRTLESVIIRAKRTDETYIEAYEADDNSDYYFVVIEPKFMSEVLKFNNHLEATNELKLQFFSQKDDVSKQIKGRKIVFYYEPFAVGEDGSYQFDNRDFTQWDTRINIRLENQLAQNIQNYFLNKAYGNNTLRYISDGYGDYWNYDKDQIVDWDDESNVTLEFHDFTMEQVQTALLAYPEGAWIARCCTFFPSTIQWLYKYIAKVQTHKLKDIPDLSTTSVIIQGLKVTQGSGLVGNGLRIHEQVSLDWLIWAIQKNVWNLLYESEKVSATENGMLKIENALKQVLDVAVREGIFSRYQINGKQLNRKQNKASLQFSATLLHTITDVEIQGTVYH